jgi:hypothetical protein
LDHVFQESEDSNLALNGRKNLKRNGKLKSASTRRRSLPRNGRTSKDIPISVPSTQTISNESMLFAADILVSHSPLRDVVVARPTLDIFGPTCSESFTIYDHASRSWKTYQDIFHWGSDEFSETWPNAGTMRNGKCFRRPELEPHTLDAGFSYWPTPCVAAEAPNMGSNKVNGPRSLMQVAREMWPTPRSPKRGADPSKLIRENRKRPSDLETAVSMWPTIRASDAERGGRGDLIQAIRGNQNKHFRMWPTPRAGERGQYQRDRGQKGKERPTLTGAVKMWPTPQARDHFPAHNAEYVQKKKAEGHGMSNLNDKVGGQLNPTWVEWLMGFPLGWTVLNASETPSSRTSRKKSEK